MYICGTLKNCIYIKELRGLIFIKSLCTKLCFPSIFVLTSHGKEAHIILTLLNISELYFPIIDIAKLLFESKLHFIFFSFSLQ